MSVKTMWRKSLAALVAFMLMTSLCAATAFADEQEAQGISYTLESNSEVETISSMQELAAMSSGNYVLINDININQASWTPISNFTGTLDGQGYKITWTGTSSSSPASITSNYGIFGTSSGIIKNLKVEGALYVTGSNVDYVSAVVGYNNGGTINGVENSAILNCGGTCYNVGGICGLNNGGYILNSSNAGAVTGYSKVGGIVGENDGVVNTCFNTAAVTGTNASKNGVGGIAGRNGDNNTATKVGKIWHCYNTGNIACESGTTKGKWVGGICGFLNSVSECKSCYNTGDLSAQSYKDHIAGKIDTQNGNTGTIERCFGLFTATGAEKYDGASVVPATELNDSSTVSILNNNGTLSRWSVGSQYPDLAMTATNTELQPGTVTPGTLSTVYVSASGNDANAGSATAPVKTLGKALALASTTGSVTIYAMTPIAMDNEGIYGTSDITIKKYTSFTGSTSALIKTTGTSVISGVVIDATGFSKAVKVLSGETAIRNGANISGAATGIYVNEDATVELNRSSISGTSYSVYSYGIINVQLNNSDDSTLRQTLKLGAPVYSSKTFNAESGEIQYSGSSSISKFIEVADGNFNLSGAVVTGNNLATNVISASSSGKINISGGTITGAGSYAVYTNNIINFQFTSPSSTCNINGTVYLEQKGNIAVGSSLASVSNTIKVMCSNPDTRAYIGTYAGMLFASYVDKFEYATTSYSITPDDTTHTLKLYANKATLPVTPGIVGSLSSLETNGAGETVTTITDADLEGKTYYRTDVAGTYVLDVSRIDIPVCFNGGGTIRIAKDVTIGSNGYIALTALDTCPATLEGLNGGVTITWEGSYNLSPISTSCSNPELSFKNITLKGADEQTQGEYATFAYSGFTSTIYLENVTFKNLKSSEDGTVINIKADNEDGAILNNVTIENCGANDGETTDVWLKYCCIKKATISGSFTRASSEVALKPEGDTSFGKINGTGTDTKMTLTPQEGYVISKYSVNNIDQAIPTEKIKVGLAGDEYEDTEIDSVLVEIAQASKDPAMTLTTDAKDLKVGDEVTVNVNMENITAYGQGTFSCSDNLTLKSIEAGSALKFDGDSGFTGTVDNKMFTFFNNTGTEDGTVAKATFTCTKAGDATVSLAGVKAGAALDPSEPEELTVADLKLSVGLNALAGDVNNSGKVNIVDAQVTYDMVKGNYADGSEARTNLLKCWTPETTGATYDLIVNVANVNGDELTASDAFAIQYFVHYGKFGEATLV